MDGILLIDKEKGVTSRDVVNKVCKIFDTKKVGHTGTLDPLATGVLVVCVGRATKLVDVLTAKDKEYIAEVTLGTLTDTLDITGNILKEESVDLTDEEINRAVLNLIKTYNQEVPKYSAVKVNGKKLYEYARNNEEVILPKKSVTIYDAKIISDIKRVNNKIIFTFKCRVSKGTYIRSLINDLAQSLNTIGIMSNLRRTKQGKFSIDNCYKVDEIDKNAINNVVDVLDDCLHIKVDDNLKKNILNGKIIYNKYNVDKVLFVSSDEKALALYKIDANDEHILKVDIMLGGI